jgi:hypothetical protein
MVRHVSTLRLVTDKKDGLKVPYGHEGPVQVDEINRVSGVQRTIKLIEKGGLGDAPGFLLTQ